MKFANLKVLTLATLTIACISSAMVVTSGFARARGLGA